MTDGETGRGRAALTARQREIAALVARGYTNQQIATELVITRGTVANHVEEILRRLNLGSRVELATWASQHGMANSQNRLLATLERLLQIDPHDLNSTLNTAAGAVADALGADKSDAFLYDPSTATLVALGTSATPLGRKQHALGLHLLPIANGGRLVQVYETGIPRHEGRVDLDTGELRGIRVGLGIRSEIGVPLVVAGERRGVLSAVSTSPDFFTDRDARFLATVSRWVAVVAHRAELSQQMASEAAAETRRAAADELVTVLAHDFRNLLTPLRGRLELVARRAQRDGYERYVTDARELVRSVDRLDSLVRDLLDTARLDEGVFGLERLPLDLVELVQQTMRDFNSPMTTIELRAPMNELVVWADPKRLRQVLENLLSNAFKVQPSGEPVVIELDVEERCAVLTVSDLGPGVPTQVLAKLFHRFAAGPSSAGLGVGLYLARGIVEAHGGSIEVHAREGQGTDFVVRLPVETNAARPRPLIADGAAPDSPSDPESDVAIDVDLPSSSPGTISSSS